MKSIPTKYSFYILVIIMLVSCTDVVDIKLPNAGARLVIEASVNWEKGTVGNEQTIKLSTSTAYFDSNLNAPVKGAVVSVTKDNDGTQFDFIDQNDGNYTTTSFIPEIGSTYTLNITYKGQNYKAQETLTGVTEINSVLQEDGFRDDEYRVRVLFDDPVEETNYYLGEFTQDNLAIPSFSSVRDEFINGNEAFVLHSSEKNVVGTAIDIKVFGISEQFYFYIEQLLEQSGSKSGAGGPFPTAPAQLRGNCKNVNNADEEVLGYFRLSEFSTASYIIQ